MLDKWQFWTALYLTSAVLFSQCFKKANRKMKNATYLTLLLEGFTAIFSLAFIPLFSLNFLSIYLFFIQTIILNDMSKKTILALTFCSICLCASESSSTIPKILFSFTKGEKRTEKLRSACDMYNISSFLKFIMKFSRIMRWQ